MADDGTDRSPGDVPSLEKREQRTGRMPGDRYVRIVRPAAREFTGSSGRYTATSEVFVEHGRFRRAWERLLRILVGRRIRSEAEGDERLSVGTGLPVLASDNISSSAYATEEAMRVLALAGAAALTLTMPVALAVVIVLLIVVISETQVIRTYPNGGGSYPVARENLGTFPGLIAASALLIDYVLTVAVSTAAGVAAISSFVPAIHDVRVPFALGLIGLLTIGNLRGVREAGLLFAAPTYAYMLAMFGLISYGLFRVATGDIPAAAQPPDPFPEFGSEALALLLILRAFSSGSVGLSGSEAVANGVPSFRRPEVRNAVTTLWLMGAIFATIFLGLTYLATTIGVSPDQHEAETLNSLLTRSILGADSPLYYGVQITTAVILLLAANTGFTGFPRLASVLAHDRFMPRHFADLGSRLAFNTGIIALALVAGLTLAAFGGSVTQLVPLYTIGVFLALCLSQSGLSARWIRTRPPRWQLRLVMNGVGALATGLVLGVVIITKFAFGAWMVLIVLPLIVWLLYATRIHYREAHDALVLDDPHAAVPEPRPPVVIVPIARIDRAALQAVAFARSISTTVKAVHISTSEESADGFKRRWDQWSPGVPLDLIVSPWRSLITPLLHYIDAIDKSDDRPITVVISEFVPRHWWEWILHSQTATRLKAALLFRPNTIVIDVPYHFADTADLAARRTGSAGTDTRLRP